MNDRYFLTGGSGFVGANIVRALAKRGAHVAVLLRNKKLNWRLQDLKGAITIYEGDITQVNFASVFAREKPTVVFHLAAYGTMPKEQKLDNMIEINIKGFARLLAAAESSSVRIVVNTGSSSEYGICEKAMKETDMPCPVNDYGVTKAAASLLSQKAARASSFSVVTLRLFSPYGYREEPTRFVPSVIRSAICEHPLHASSPTFVRDFVYIEDVVRAYLLTVKKGRKVNGQIINIGSGYQHTLRDVVFCTEKILNRNIDVHWQTKRGQKRQVEPKRWEADISKAKRLLGWEPVHSLESGLSRTIQYMQKAACL